MPVRVTIGERSLAEGKLEITQRRTGETEMIPTSTREQAWHSSASGRLGQHWLTATARALSTRLAERTLFGGDI